MAGDRPRRRRRRRGRATASWRARRSATRPSSPRRSRARPRWLGRADSGGRAWPDDRRRARAAVDSSPIRARASARQDESPSDRLPDVCRHADAATAGRAATAQLDDDGRADDEHDGGIEPRRRRRSTIVGRRSATSTKRAGEPRASRRGSAHGVDDAVGGLRDQHDRRYGCADASEDEPPGRRRRASATPAMSRGADPPGPCHDVGSSAPSAHDGRHAARPARVRRRYPAASCRRSSRTRAMTPDLTRQRRRSAAGSRAPAPTMTAASERPASTLGATIVACRDQDIDRAAPREGPANAIRGHRLRSGRVRQAERRRPSSASPTDSPRIGRPMRDDTCRGERPKLDRSSSSLAAAARGDRSPRAAAATVGWMIDRDARRRPSRAVLL